MVNKAAQIESEATRIAGADWDDRPEFIRWMPLAEQLSHVALHIADGHVGAELMELVEAITASEGD